MKINNLMMGIIGIVVCAIMIGGALLPAVGSANDVLKTGANNVDGISYIMLNDSNETVNVTYTNETSTLNIDGEEYVNDEESGYTYGAVIYSDSFYVLGGANFGFTFWCPDATAAYAYNDWTLTLSGGTYTFNHATSGTFTGTYDFCYVANPNGDYASYLLTDGDKIRIDAGDKIAYTKLQANYNINLISPMDKVAQNYNASVYVLEDNNWVRYDATVSPTIEYNDMGYYEISPGTATYNGTTIGLDTFIAPIEYHYVSDENSGAYALFNVIPFIAIAGLIIAGIYVFISRK